MSDGKYLFHWRSGNNVELLIDGHRFFPAMVSAIDNARDYILLEMYLFESGDVASRFIDALKTAAKRGVRIFLMLDDYGVRGLSRFDRARLQTQNIWLCYYNPLRFGYWLRNMARDHRKLLLVDGELAFLGGAGITDEFDPLRHPERRWRETMVSVRGPVVADLQVLFGNIWMRVTGAVPAVPSVRQQSLSGGFNARVTRSDGLRVQETKRSLLKRIRNAERQIWLCTAYFVPSRRIRRALRRASERGVDVRLLVPGPRTDHTAVRFASHKYYDALLQAGARIFEYQPRVLHTKAVVCDDWVSVGSSNFDRWTLRWNLEANLEVDDTVFAESVIEMLSSDMQEAVECEQQHWIHRPWWRRLREWWPSVLERWTMMVGRHKRK